MGMYHQLRLDLDSKTGSYVAMNDYKVVYQSPSYEEVFNWARERANVLILGRRFKAPLLNRRKN